jgi:phosphoglycerate dehydrogenase-like enzyme
MSRPRILVNTEQFKQGDPLFQPLLDAGYEVEVNETFRLPGEEELIAKLATGVVATIAGGEPYTERVFRSAAHLRLVARWGVGYDRVDTGAATAAGVPIAMAFGANHESVAEFAQAMALHLACRLGPRDTMVRGGQWSFDGFHAGLWGRTAGIVGLGRIGAAMARRCRAGGMRILVADPLADEAQLAEVQAARVDLDELLGEADLVSLHAPATPATRHLIDARRLALMKPSALLINTARGPLIDEQALVEALAAGHLGGVGLDVFEQEPLPATSRLREFDRVLLSPHVSGMDLMAQRRVTERCVNNILDFFAGRHAALRPYVVNPTTLKD